MKKLRVLVVALLATLTLMPFCGGPAQAHKSKPSDKASFTLNARVLDSGQQIVSVTINSGRLGIDRSSLTTDTFSVHAKTSDPFPGAHDPDQFFSTYDLDRTVTGVHLDRNGRLVIDQGLLLMLAATRRRRG